MSNVLNIFQEYFDKKNAKRIRFKVDPTLKAGFDLATTYEGFVLSETHNGQAVIYIPIGGAMGLHNMNGILPIPDRLGPIKDKIVQVLKGRQGEEYLQQIMSSDCFDEIQQYLKHAGYNDADIIELLKSVITNEALMPTIKKAGKAIGKGVKAVLKAPFKAGEKLSRWKRKADAATRYLKTFEPGYLERDTPRWVPNPNLKAIMFIKDPEFMKWYNDKYDMKNNTTAIKNILQNASVNQLNYWARKFYENSGKYIS